MLVNLKNLLLSRYFLWVLLAILGVSLTIELINNYPIEGRVFRGLMHESGEMAARLMIVALLISPLRLIFPNSRAIQWLARQRRTFGVAAFSFAALHLLVYLLFKEFPRIIEDLNEVRIWAGWIAFIVFIPLAATSSNWAVRKVGGQNWKKLHKLIYVAAVAVAIHWFLARGGVGPTIVHFTPLVLLEAYRLYIILIKNRSLQAS